MEQNKNDRQSQLMYVLLRRLSYPEPESFKLFFRIRLEDMFPPRGERPVLNRAERVYFHAVLCQGDEVLTAALPCFLLPDGTQEELAPEDLAALRAAGLPLFSDFLSLDGQMRRDPAPSGWRFPYVPVSRDLDELLIAKKMVEFSASIPIPTQYGKHMGLCRARWYKWDPDDGAFTSRGCGGLFCSANGWVRLWERPWKGVPDWQPLSLNTRLERLRAGRSCNPGHCMSALQQLEGMPVAPTLSERMKGEYIQRNLPRLRTLYGSGVTYGQAAREAARLLRSDSEKDQQLGRSSLFDLTVLFCSDHSASRSGLSRTAEEKESVIDETRPEDRSLSSRLARAGIVEHGDPYLPLVWDNLEDVFLGLGRLTGSDAPALEFFGEILPKLPPDWDSSAESEHQWDGTFDGMVYYLAHYGDDFLDFEDCDTTFIDQVKYHLLIEPFCFLDQVRSLEEEHSGLLEEIREQNKALKEKLERMKSDVNAQ